MAPVPPRISTRREGGFETPTDCAEEAALHARAPLAATFFRNSRRFSMTVSHPTRSTTVPDRAGSPRLRPILLANPEQGMLMLRFALPLLLAAAAHPALAADECLAHKEYDRIVAAVTERFYDKTFRGLDWPA